MENVLNWIEAWYKGSCNGDWEHNYGVRIDTIDNPGWSVVIDLHDTKDQEIRVEKISFEESPSNWYNYSVMNGKYKAYGSPDKLKFLLEMFRNIVQ